MIVLDTSILIEIFDRASGQRQQLLDRLDRSGDEVLTTSINVHETLIGMMEDENKVGAISELMLMQILPYDRNDAVISAGLERYSEALGRRIAKADAMIAAIVINNNAKLFTLDKKHFPLLKEKGLRLFE
jgi:predicted nucleic acid-binding protein